MKKTLLVLMLLMGSSNFSYAEDNSLRVASLAQAICTRYGISGLQFAEEVKQSIKRHIELLEGIKNPSGAQMLQFLNHNRHKMECTVAGVTKNYMMFAFDKGFHGSLFDELIVDDLIPEDFSVLLNVNAVSYTGPGGTPETVLDYMDNLIKTNKFGTAATSEIIDLRDMFIESFNGKRFYELTALEQSQFKQQR